MALSCVSLQSPTSVKTEAALLLVCPESPKGVCPWIFTARPARVM